MLVLRANALANECKIADWWIANWTGSADGRVERNGLCDGEERERGFGWDGCKIIDDGRVLKEWMAWGRDGRNWGSCHSLRTC